MDESEHKPSANCYRHNKCRRPECRVLNNEYMRQWRISKQETLMSAVPHGLNGYRNYGCRCPVCVTAKAADWARYSEERKNGENSVR